MKPRNYLIIGLLGVVLLIVFMARRPGTEVDKTISVPGVQIARDPSEIVEVEIDRNDKLMRLELLKGVWMLTEPVRQLASEEAMDQFLEGVKRFKLTDVVSANPEKRGVFVVNEHGTRVVFTKENGSRFELIVGKKGPHPGQAYVRLSPGDTVYLAQGITPALVNMELRDWRQKTIYRADPELIKAFTIRHAGNKVAIQRTGNRWTANGQVVPEEMARSAIRSISFIQAEDFIDTTIILRSSPAVQLDLVEAGSVRMDFYDPVSRNASYVLKVSGSSTVFVVSKVTVQPLLKIVERLSQQTEVPPTRVATQTPAGSTPRAQPAQPAQRPGTPVGKGVEEEGVLVVHTVKSGETLEAIARRYNLTVDQIKRWNLLQKDVVSPGMELYVFVRK